jgi:adenosylcobinamide-GDP ribazoletransferase
MKLLQSIVIAFSMYSKLPMPRVDWTKENMRYAMCFFPWIGVVVGLVFYIWGNISLTLPIGNTIRAVIFTMIPIVLTGGIHLDGLLDTADALSSFQPMERRLEILKDSHAGAFAIIVGSAYFLLYFGITSELTAEMLLPAAAGFVLSRSLSGFSVTTFQCAKDSGLVRTFSSGADKKRARIILLLQAVVSAAVTIIYQPISGTAAVLAALVCFIYYRYMAYQKFGGITGDLAGWFLQVCELCIIAAVVVVSWFF